MPTSSRLGLTAILALLPLFAAGCTAGSSGSLATAAGPTSASSPTATQSAPAAGTCTPDYCGPADWDTAPASTPLAAIRPFVEPLNVIISARSTVSLADVQQALGDWKTVSTSSSASVAGIRVKCISGEEADVSGAGYVPQTVAWRLGGCLRGNELSLSGDEDHVRIWHQAVPGAALGAWLIAASYETMCIAPHGALEPATDDKVYAALHPSGAYHCVDGGPGSLTARHPSGYDDGAQAFVAAIVAAAKGKGWTLTEHVVSRPIASGTGTGEGGVPFSGTVYLLTITALPHPVDRASLTHPAPAYRTAPARPWRYHNGQSVPIEVLSFL
jgi:hypothetical protein